MIGGCKRALKERKRLFQESKCASSCSTCAARTRYPDRGLLAQGVAGPGAELVAILLEARGWVVEELSIVVTISESRLKTRLAKVADALAK